MREEAPAAAGELAPGPPARPAEDSASGTIEDHFRSRAINLERARTLGRRIRVEVAIDESGWLRREIELAFTREPSGALRPVAVRVGREASDDDVLAEGGVVGRCDEYNRAIGKLHQLAEDLATMVRGGRLTLEAGSPLAYAHFELSRLDELIARRQRITMGFGVVRLTTLRREIEFFERCDAHLAPILRAATRAANAAAPRPAALARWARRWLRW